MTFQGLINKITSALGGGTYGERQEKRASPELKAKAKQYNSVWKIVSGMLRKWGQMARGK